MSVSAFHVGSCGKRTYASRAAARRATRKVHGKVKTYYCPLCGGWHTVHLRRHGEKSRRPRYVRDRRDWSGER